MKKGLSRRQFMTLLGTVVGTTTLAACAPAQPAPAEGGAEAGAPAGEVTSIVYWHGWSGRFADYLNRVNEAFAEENPDVTVEFVQLDWGELYPKLLTAVAADAPPDTYVVGNEDGSLYSLAAQKVITPMEDIATPDDIASLKEVIHPSIFEIGTYEGKLWALPKWTQGYALIVNTQHLEEAGIDPNTPPETLEELDALAEQLYQRDSDGTIRRIGFDPGSWYFHYWGRFNGQYVDEVGEPTATHPNNLECLKWMTKYSEQYDPTKIADFRAATEGSDVTEPFISGLFSIVMEGPWRLGDIYEYKNDMQYTVWKFPKPAGVEGFGMSTGGDIPVIPRGVKNPEASFRWCRYLIGVDNPEVYATLWTVGLRPHIPTSETVARGPAFEKVYEMFPGFEVYIDDFFGGERVAPPAKLPVAQFYSSRLNSNTEQARLVQITPEQALETTQEEVVDELTKWRAANPS